LVSFGGNQFITALVAADYVSFVLVLLMIFGVSFELPLVIVMLNRIGMIPYDNLRRWRRGIIFALFVFAAIATPGTDPISMVALAAAMTVLFELSVQISRIHDRRKARREVAQDDGLSDDEPSPAYQPEPEPASPPDVHAAGFDDVT
jgi:sec-independent protein translocase protein TatC